MARCGTCGAKARGDYSLLGEPVCPACATRTNGMVVGGLAAGVGGAAAGPGILSWVRGALNPRKKAKTAKGDQPS